MNPLNFSKLDPVDSVRPFGAQRLQIDSSVQGFLGYVAVIAMGALLVLFVQENGQKQYDIALDNYRKAALAKAVAAADAVHDAFNQIYQDTRTISFLPSIRNIDRHGTNLDGNARASVQQIYNNLKSNIAVSEIYIVPVDFDPDHFDPVTGKNEEPVLMFDELISNAALAAIARHKGERPQENMAEEVETFEYAQLKQTVGWLKALYPHQNPNDPFNVPIVSGVPLMTCDNTVYNKTRNDRDRMGLIFSVPFYGEDGHFRGVVATIIRSSEVQKLLADGNVALIDPTHDFHMLREAGRQAALSEKWVAAAKPDPTLLFSTLTPVIGNDPRGQWQLWAGLPDATFLKSDTMRFINTYKIAGLGFATLLSLAGFAAWTMLQRNFRLISAREQELARSQILAWRFSEKEYMEKQLNDYIERLQKAHYETQRAREVAERANAAKGSFLANMSHEIRTPMNAVLGMTRLLLETKMDAEQRNWADIILRSGENLLEIINDILDFSKIEAGKMTLEPVAFDLQDAVMHVTDLLIFRAQEKNIELLVDIAPDTPRHLIGDVLRFRQILINLVSNAIKFTEEGHVLIRISSQEKDEATLRFYVEVEDTGIGIPADKLEHIFDKFTQAEESTTRRFGGTGLGLAICHHLTQMMEGSIGVASTPGKGSVFRFDVLLLKAEAVADYLPDCDLGGVRLLIFSDYALNRDLGLRMARSFGMQAEGALSLEDAQVLLTRAANSQDPYEVVMLDSRANAAHMLRSIAAIQELPAMQDARLIVVTPFKQALMRKAKGIAGYISQPMTMWQLHATLRILMDAKRKGLECRPVTRHAIAQWQQGGMENSDKTAVPLQNKRVLVTDDMKVNQILLTKVLSKMGCDVVCANNGKEAVEALQTDRYDLVFMDCQMPEMDGFDATKMIRALEKNGGRHTVVVALTADAMVGDREKCLNAGMDDYIRKPFKPEEIAAMMQKWCA